MGKEFYENKRFDWIKSIHWYRVVNIGRLADVGLVNLPNDDLTCLIIIIKENNVRGPG